MGEDGGVSLDVAAVRARFTALQRDLVFFDAPGGSQVPDEVIDAIATYLRESNANTSGPYETSRRTEALEARARVTAGRFLGCAPEEAVFGPNMTTLSFALSSTFRSPHSTACRTEWTSATPSA